MVWVEVFMTIDINLLRRLRDDIVPCSTVQRSNFDLVHIDSVEQGDMRCPVFRLTPAGHAYLDMLEEHERHKTEAATLAQLARDLYDGEEITPAAALNRLHQECMTATARVSELEEEVKLVRRDAVFLRNIITDEPRLAEIRARRDGSYEGETVRDLLRDTSWLIIAVDRLKAELGQRTTEGVQTIARMQDDIDLLLDLLKIPEEDEKSGCPLARVERVTMAEAKAAQRTAEMERLKAELEEQRLVVRAHLWDWQGRINPAWHPHNRLWCRTFPDGRTGQVGALHRDEEHHTVTWSMGVLGSVTEGRRPALTGGTSDNLREGMRAVEAAWAATASPDRPSPADGA